MIRYVEHNRIDRSKWDKCIDASEHGNIFVCSWYLDTVAGPWEALVFNDYDAVFPIAPAAKFGLNYLYQPFFTRYFGVYSKSRVTAEVTTSFLNNIPEKFRYMEFCFHESQSINGSGFELKEKVFQELDLSLPYEKLHSGFKDNGKRSIKKAVKSAHIIKEGITGSEVVDLFKKTKGNELEVFDTEDYKKLVSLMNNCTEQGFSESFGIYSEKGELSAAAFFMRYRNRYVFLKSGLTDEGKNNGHMYLIFDTFLRKHAESGYILDFGGSSVASVARFYKNFGAKDCVYLQVKKNKLPTLVKWLKSLKK
ncbi:MAG: hypothetical protein K0Q95_73 [Bacteroidota bacterium]|jgi:hypothetical protein|nr:hypothetical protein [Bacteroidota bacterium]